MRIFRIVTLLAKILTLTAATASLMGVAITGFYPGIIVLLLLTLIPIASIFNAKKLAANPMSFREIIT